MSIAFKFKDKTIGVGDKVKVIQNISESGKERKQIFIGTIIKIKGDGDNKTFTVRRIGSNLIGIEKIFPVNSPNINEITISKSGLKGIRKSKLYYIRNKSKKEIDKIYSRSKRRSESSDSKD